MKANLRTVAETCRRRIKQSEVNKPDPPEEYIDMYGLWKAHGRKDEEIFKAVRDSGIFNEERIETFVRFNYRNVENKNITFTRVQRNVLAPRNKSIGRPDKKHLRGTMSVCELWS